MSLAASTPTNARFAVTVAGRTDVGRLRDHNEDRLLVYPALDLFAVADGMGGHNAGEVASALAATSLENCFRASRHGEVSGELFEDPRPLTDEARRLLAAVRKANADVFEISRARPEHKGMGTTLVAAHVARANGLFHVAHVGDSRCYRLRGGRLEQLTRDHSLIGDALAFKPDLTKEELALFPKNVISRAVGRGAKVEVDVRSEPLSAGDVYLLCSDGLSGPVEDPAIRGILSALPDPREACRALIAAANEGGGPDNITAVVVRIDLDDGTARPAAATNEDDDWSEFEGMERRCLSCRASLEPDTRFCGQCGTAV